jgi:hypothetical protein
MCTARTFVPHVDWGAQASPCLEHGDPHASPCLEPELVRIGPMNAKSYRPDWGWGDVVLHTLGYSGFCPHASPCLEPERDLPARPLSFPRSCYPISSRQVFKLNTRGSSPYTENYHTRDKRVVSDRACVVNFLHSGNSRVFNLNI